ncbi:MAG: hypothetical protein HOK61_00520 [Alphaproteobacteria bacterium]|nr:hypothetical protein [Alphaproteobacteria bacterium]
MVSPADVARNIMETVAQGSPGFAETVRMRAPDVMMFFDQLRRGKMAVDVPSTALQSMS